MPPKLEHAALIRKSAVDNTEPVVLSAGPFPEDHEFLRFALPQCRFSIANSVRAACAALCRDRVGLIVCADRLPGGSWKDLLCYVAPLPDPPPLIVTAAFPDDHLWTEVLNLGGYDVLAKPFQEQEVASVAAQVLGLLRPGRKHAAAGGAAGRMAGSRGKL